MENKVKEEKVLTELASDFGEFNDTPDLYKDTTKKVNQADLNGDQLTRCQDLVSLDQVITASLDHHQNVDQTIHTAIYRAPLPHLHQPFMITTLCKSSSSESDACSSTRPLLEQCNELAKFTESHSFSSSSPPLTVTSSLVSPLNNEGKKGFIMSNSMSDQLIMKMLVPNASTGLPLSASCYQVKPDNNFNDTAISVPNCTTDAESSRSKAWSKIFPRISRRNREKFLRNRSPTQHPHPQHPESPRLPFKRDTLVQGLFMSRILVIILVIVFVSAIIITIIGSLTLTNLIYHPEASASGEMNLLDNTVSRNSITSGHASESSKQWWRRAVVYEIFTASFKDTNNDGFGDLNGVRSKLAYLKDLGVNVIRLNSVFQAHNYPNDYENIINFTQIDGKIGKVKDFAELVNEVHEHGLKLILDINLCCTSSQHPWAQKWTKIRQQSVMRIRDEDSYQHGNLHHSDADQDDGSFLNFYFPESSEFQIPSGFLPSKPTNLSFTRSALEAKRFDTLLLLNWSNPLVRCNILESIQFWWKLGVDGLYLHNIELVHLEANSKETILDILGDIRSTLTNRNASFGLVRDRILATSQRSLDLLTEQISKRRATQYMQRHGSETKSKDKHHRLKENVNSFFELAFNLLAINENVSNGVESVREQVNGVFLNAATAINTKKASNRLPWTVWCLSDSGRSRFATRMGKSYSSAATFLLIMLPGSISMFYGDEIALQDSIDPVLNKPIKSGQLTPVSWTSELFGGFTGAANGTQPWMPMNMDYIHNNVQNSIEAISRLKQALAFRTQNLMMLNEKQPNYLFQYVDNGFIVLERYFTKHSASGTIRYRFVLFANLGAQQRTQDFSDKFHFGTIKLSSNPKRIHEFLYIKSLTLEPGEAIIAEIE